jgi:L-alanine-DL-glutamate epimerase-like enolase superfamily enzyme
MLIIKAEMVSLSLKEVFRIARGETSGKENCIVGLDDALGECCPSVYYGYSARDCYEEINRASIRIEERFELSGFLDSLDKRYHDKKSLLAGLDIVLHDYIARRLELPLYQYLGIPAPFGKETSYTLSIDQPDNMKARLRAAEGFGSIKLKIGSAYDHENLAIIRDIGKFKIRVDANGAYTYDQFLELLPDLNAAGVELVEQPLEDSPPENLKRLRNKLDAPIFLDESIIEPEDIYRYEGAIDGINIKLQRVGGIRPALKMIQIAKALGMKIMFGCMLETNIGNSAAAQLAGFADFLDLDSSYLLKDDPFEGIIIKDGKILIPDRNGIGVRRRTNV